MAAGVQVEWFSDKGDRLPECWQTYLTVGPRGVMRVAKAYVPAQALKDWHGKPDYHWWECEGRHVAVAWWAEKPLPPGEGQTEERTND